MVYTRCASYELQFDGLREVVARERQGGLSQKPGIVRSSALQYRVSTHQIRRGRREARLSTSQRSAEFLCAKIKSANREVSEGKVDL